MLLVDDSDSAFGQRDAGESVSLPQGMGRGTWASCKGGRLLHNFRTGEVLKATEALRLNVGSA